MNGDRVVGKEVVCSLYYLGEFQAIFANVECISCEFDIFSGILFFFYFFISLILLRIIYSKVFFEGILYFVQALIYRNQNIFLYIQTSIGTL